MSDARPDVKAVFGKAMEIQSPPKRAAYLDEVCGQDAALRAEVEDLLQAHEEAGSFMARPAAQSAETIGLSPITEGPGTVIGPYKLLQQIGEGGFGVVYMADQREPVRRKVALKIIKPGMDTKQVIARFEAERQALALMDHPNIARVLDAGATDTGRPYFVMDLVKGVPITEYCDKNELSTEQRLGLFVEVCRAVQHAHQKGVIHRDIKPTNVLVTLHDGVPVPKIIDFGVSKAINQELTEKTLFTAFGQMVGTPQYMSPEQAEMSGLDVDTRSDVFSLGVLLYELLTGGTPLEADRLRTAGYAEMQRIIREEEPPRPSVRLSTGGEQLTVIAKHRSIDPNRLQQLIRGELDWIVMKSLEKDRRRRYESPSAFAADVTRFLGGEAVQACPPSVLYRFRKYARRNRVYVTAAAVLIGALLMGVASITIGLFQAYAAQREAETAQRAAESAAHDMAEARSLEKTERERAEQERRRAEQERERAEQMANQRRQGLVRLHVKTGMTRVEEGDYLDALPWLVEALRLDQGDPERERPHRLRIGMTLDRIPRLVRVWRNEQKINQAKLSLDGRKVLTVSGETVRIWDVATGEAVTPSIKHAGHIHDAQFSNNGQRVITSGADNTGRVWDATTGSPVTPPLNQEAVVTRCGFTADDKRVATVGGGAVRLWDAVSGEPVTPLLRHDGLRDADLSGDDKLLATMSGGPGSSVRFWDVAKGEPSTLPAINTTWLYDMDISPDGKWLATAHDDYRALVWDIATGQPISPPLPHAFIVTGVAFHPDGQRVVTASHDATARIWHAASGEPTAPPLRHRGAMSAAEFTTDGQCVVTVGSDGTARVWDAKTGDAVTPFLTGNNAGTTLSRDGRRMLTADTKGAVRVWDLAVGSWVAPTLKHDDRVRCVAFSADGRRLLTATVGGTARVWDAQTGKPVGPRIVHRSELFDAELSADGQRVLTAIYGEARVWDATTGRPVTAPMNHGDTIRYVALSPDGKLVATASHDHTARVWDATTGQPLTPPLEHNQVAWNVAFHPNGKQVATACWDGTAQIWDIASGQRIGSPLLYDEDQSVRVVTFSPDGRQLLAGSNHGAQMWDPATGKTLGARMDHAGMIWYAEFSRDGQRAVTASIAGSARLWNVSSGQAIGEPLQHQGGVFWAVFSPDSRLVCTASMDGTARVWDVATGEPVSPPLGHNGAVNRVAFSPRGDQVATASADGTARIWRITSDQKSVAELLDLAALVTDQRIGATGKLETVPAGELLAKWNVLHATHPEDFAVSSSDGQQWHSHWAQRCLEEQQWSGALMHLGVLCDQQPEDWRHRLDRGRVLTMLHRQEEAEAEFTKAFELRPDYQEPFVMAGSWVVGPYVGSLEAESAPETNHDPARPLPGSGEEELRWRDAFTTARLRDELETILEGDRQSSAYSLSQVYAFDDLDMALVLGHDCPIRVWLNGVLLCQDGQSGNMGSGQNEIPVRLQSGWNSLLLKLVGSTVPQLSFDLSSDPARRGRAYARRGQWEKAAADLAKAYEQDPYHHWNGYYLSSVLIHIGDQEGYRRLCRQMLERFSQTDDPRIAERTAKMCLILPEAIDQRNLPAQLAERAVAIGKDDEFFPYFLLSKAIAEYRDGHYQSSVDWLSRSIDKIPEDSTWQAWCKALACYFLAMGHHQLGASQPASESLDQAAQITSRYPQEGDGDLGPDWHDYLFCETVRREAEKLVGK